MKIYSSDGRCRAFLDKNEMLAFVCAEIGSIEDIQDYSYVYGLINAMLLMGLISKDDKEGLLDEAHERLLKSKMEVINL